MAMEPNGHFPELGAYWEALIGEGEGCPPSSYLLGQYSLVLHSLVLSQYMRFVSFVFRVCISGLIIKNTGPNFLQL